MLPCTYDRIGRAPATPHIKPSRGSGRHERGDIVDVDPVLTRLREAGRHYSLARGEVFFCQGDSAASVCWVLDGRVLLSVVSEGGKEVIVGVADAGAVFGETALTLAARARTTTATALEPSTVLAVSARVLTRLSQDHPAVGALVMQALLVRVAELQAQVAEQMMAGTEERLVHVLLLLASREDAAGVAHLPRLSQEVLARMVGTTRSRVNRLLHLLRAHGVQHSSQSGIVVELATLRSWQRRTRASASVGMRTPPAEQASAGSCR